MLLTQREIGIDMAQTSVVVQTVRSACVAVAVDSASHLTVDLPEQLEASD